MKKLILLSLLFFVFIFNSNSQSIFPYDSITGEVYYTEVKEVSLTKNQLFSNAKAWLAMNLTSYKKSVDMEDLTSGKIIAKILNKNTDGLGWDSEEFTISIDCKDNKFRYKIFDIKFETFTHMNSGDFHAIQVMADYRKFYLDGVLKEASKHALELNQKFKDIGTSIVKGMIQSDDF